MCGLFSTLFYTQNPNNMKRLIILFAGCGFWGSLLAQENDAGQKKSGDTVAAKTEFIISASYNSALNYYGRTDSLKSTGYYPTLGVNFKNGLYLHASFVCISNATYSGYAASIVEGGYQFKNKQESWAGNVFVNTFFYKDNSELVQSALKGTAGINLSHLNKIINLNLGGDIKLGDKTDIGASAGIDHVFRIEKVGKGVIVINPSAWGYAGTQNFTSTYYEEKKFLLLPAGQDTITSNSRKFSLLSYELSCPVIFGLGKMNLILSPAYVIPQNLITIPNRPDLSETGHNLFYLTTTLKFTL